MAVRLCLTFTLLLALVGRVPLPVGTAYARDIFVDNRLGDDRNSGGLEEVSGSGNGPTRSITRALELAAKGDRIIIANTGESYRESITLQGGRHSGSDYRPFVIIGRGAVIDGTVEVGAEAINFRDWEPYQGDVVRVQPPRFTYQSLYLGAEPAQRVRLLETRELKTLEPKQWTLLDGYLYFRVEKDRVPVSYEPRVAAHSVGMTLYDVHDVHIYDLTVQGFILDGLNAHDNARNIELYNVNGSYNGRSGLSVGGSCRVKLVECSGTGNGVAQLRTEGFCRVEVADCKFDEQTASPIDQREGGKVVTEVVR